MAFVILVLKKNRNDLAYLHYKDASDGGMCVLGLYLTDDLGCPVEPWIRKSVIGNTYGGVGNITGVEVTDETVTLYDPFIEEDEEGTEIVIPKKEFFHILDEWEKVCKERPQEVTIIREGDTFRFKKTF